MADLSVQLSYVYLKSLYIFNLFTGCSFFVFSNIDCNCRFFATLVQQQADHEHFHKKTTAN